MKPADDFKSPPHISDEELVRRITADSGSVEVGRAMEMALRNSMGEDISIAPEPLQFVDIECEIHHEADAQWRPASKDARRAIANGQGESHWPPWDSQEYRDQHKAWERHEGAKTKLRQIMSEYFIKSWSRIPGEDIAISQAQWAPDYLDFDINVSASLCGSTHPMAAEWGKGLIDRAGFDRAIEAEFGLAPGRTGKDGGNTPPETSLYALSIWKMIGIVEEEIDSSLTTNEAAKYFQRKGKHTIHENFVDAEIIEDKIVWKDADGNRKKFGFRALQRHRRERRKSTKH